MATTAEQGRPSAGTVATGADRADRTALLLGAGFLILAVTLHLLSAIKLAYPSFVPGVAFLSYGRLQPMANAATLFGWLTFMNLAAVYYLVPRLTGARLWNEPIAVTATLATGALTAVSIIAIGLGFTDGRPYADFPLLSDILLLATYLVPLAVTVQTIRQRTETSSYVSLYYILGGLVWLVGGVLVGNFPGQAVIGGAIQNEFYLSTVTGQWALGIGIGAAYYIVPKVTGNPLFSRPLAMVGFWSLALTTLWAGAAQLVYGPTGDWVETIGTVFAFGLVIPAISVLTNLVGTMQGKWEFFRTHPDVRFAIVASVGAVLVAFVGGIQGFRSVSAVIGLTTFNQGTQFAAMWAVATVFAFAFALHMVPRTSGRKLYSVKTTNTMLRAMLVGVGLVSGALWIAGLASGYTWVAGAYSGTSALAGDGFVATANAVGGLYSLSLLGMLLVTVGATGCLYSVWRTYTSGASAQRELLVFAGEETTS